MNLKHIFPQTLVAGALLSAGMGSQAYVVTLAPSGTPLGCSSVPSVALIDCTTFTADSVVGSLGSNLAISNYQDPNLVGPYGATYSESGQIAIQTFKLGSTTTKFAGPGLGFTMYATFTLSGAGVWSKDIAGNIIYTAGSGILSNSAIYGEWGGGGPVKLADLALLPGNLSAVANATLASTNLSAFFQITPVAGSTGIGGFFQAPAIWNVDLYANNVGFGAGTGTVTPSPLVDNSPAFFITNNFSTTPVNQGGTGSFNGAFTAVPEPGALSLVALALIGLGLTGKRKAASKA